MSRETGRVKWFNNAKGYGFIERSSGGDVFVHHTAIQADGYRTLEEGQSVEFTVVQGPKGLQAQEVTRQEGWFEPPIDQHLALKPIGFRAFLFGS